MKTHQGKVALVTGAARGIGKATALRLAGEGARVAVNFSRDRTGAEETVAEIASAGGQAIAVQADVADRVAVMRMIDVVTSELGPVDVLVNNSGVASYGSLLDVDDSEIDRVMGVNLRGALYCVQAVAPSMINRGGGRIINVSSIAALGTAVPQISLYSVSKAALNMLTKRLALELGEHGINVNAVCPGGTNTALLTAGQALISAPAAPQQSGPPPRNNILGRIADPGEIAAVICFLAGPDASFLTAQVVTVDGGVLRLLTRSE